MAMDNKKKMQKLDEGATPKEEPSTSDVGSYVGTLPEADAGKEETKATELKVSKSSQGAITPKKDRPELKILPKAKGKKVRTSTRQIAKKAGHPVETIISTDEKKVEAKAKIPRIRKPKVHTAEKGTGNNTGALPAIEEKPAKEGPSEKATASDCGYGWVELQGKRYDFDVIVHVDGSVSKREKIKSKKQKKKYGHTPLTRKELNALGKEMPEMIIIGTGHSGSMPLTPKAERFLEDFVFFIGKTPMAMEKLATCEKKAVALIHVTC